MVLLGLGQIVFGPVSDRIGRRPVLIGGAMLFAAASFCLAASSSAIPFVAFRFLQAVGASAALVATFATIRDVYADRPESTVIYSLFSSILAFVPALGPIAGAMLAERFGWRSIFVTLGAFAVIALVQALPRWHETRPSAAALPRRAFGPLFRSLAFWTYTLGFSAAMGTFFVFFSTSPRVLIDRAGYSELQFSLAFATVAIVMIITARFARRFVSRWGTSGSLLRGMCMLLLGAALLAAGQSFGAPSSWTFVASMWVMAVGIVFTGSVTANGALEGFGYMAGSAVAVYFCVQSLIVGTAGTLLVIGLPGDSAWPLVVYASTMAGVVLIARRQLQSRRHAQA
jgi:DHA1 family florfenicol/chloramphenicol resistance protein-like MFS transporter